jgi:hypothetical protein
MDLLLLDLMADPSALAEADDALGKLAALDPPGAHPVLLLENLTRQFLDPVKSSLRPHFSKNCARCALLACRQTASRTCPSDRRQSRSRRRSLFATKLC